MKATLAHFTKEKAYKQTITLAGNKRILHTHPYSVIIAFELILNNITLEQ